MWQKKLNCSLLFNKKSYEVFDFHFFSYFWNSKHLFERIYPPGSKSEALHLGVQLILLYFIRIPLLITETFFLFWWSVVGSGWSPTFWFFESLDNNMVYTLGIYVYIYIYISIVINSEKILVGLISISWWFARHSSKSL